MVTVTRPSSPRPGGPPRSRRAARPAARAATRIERTSSRMLLAEVLGEHDRPLAQLAQPVPGGLVTVDARPAEVAQRELEHAPCVGVEPLGAEPGEDGIQLRVVPELGVELLDVLRQGVGPVADRLVGVHLGEERPDGRCVGQGDLRVVPRTEDLERVPGRVGLERVDRGPRRGQLLGAAGGDPVEPAVGAGKVEGRGRRRAGVCRHDGTVCRRAPARVRSPRLPAQSQSWSDRSKIPARSSPRTVRGLVASRRCCLRAPSTRSTDVARAVADPRGAVGQADVTHEPRQHVRQQVGRVGRRLGAGLEQARGREVPLGVGPRRSTGTPRAR